MYQLGEEVYTVCSSGQGDVITLEITRGNVIEIQEQSTHNAEGLIRNVSYVIGYWKDGDREYSLFHEDKVFNDHQKACEKITDIICELKNK